MKLGTWRVDHLRVSSKKNTYSQLGLLTYFAYYMYLIHTFNAVSNEFCSLSINLGGMKRSWKTVQARLGAMPLVEIRVRKPSRTPAYGFTYLSYTNAEYLSYTNTDYLVLAPGEPTSYPSTPHACHDQNHPRLH
jgi:hypothetical protein